MTRPHKKNNQNFYIEHPDVSKRSDDETLAWRNKCGIVIQGEGIPKPAMTFEEASMPEYVLREVMKQGFSAPTPIQSQGWPMALLGRDMVGISATGSGKTLAFLLPAMIHINAQVWQELSCACACTFGCSELAYFFWRFWSFRCQAISFPSPFKHCTHTIPSLIFATLRRTSARNCQQVHFC